MPPNLEELIENGLARRELKDHTDGQSPYVTRYTLDLDITLVVTEHRYPKGSVPRGAEVAYGDNIKSLAALLCVEGVIAQERLSKLFSEMTRGAIRLSDASIEKFMTELSVKLDGEIAHIKTSLLNAPVMNVDETPQRCSQKPDYSGDEPVLHSSKGTSFNVYIRTHINTMNCSKKDTKPWEHLKPKKSVIMSFAKCQIGLRSSKTTICSLSATTGRPSQTISPKETYDLVRQSKRFPVVLEAGPVCKPSPEFVTLFPRSKSEAFICSIPSLMLFVLFLYLLWLSSNQIGKLKDVRS